MMSTIVSKFGGTSMADAVTFQKVREIIQCKRHPHYIILSAPGKRFAGDEKITDLLCRAHAEAMSAKKPKLVLHKIRNRFEEIISTLHVDIDTDLLMETLAEDIHHSPDLAASRGEYLCARIFATYTGLPFVDAAELIHFDRYGRILPEQTYASIRAMARRLSCAVIPGFYGSMPDDGIRTFTRGGSDITGALIAAALNADVYENWTDVDGLMSIDPNLCRNAVRHTAVSYRQMHLIAKAGAQILHPCCLEPVREAGVPTLLKNTFSPEKPGTYISDHVCATVPCICLRKNLQIVNTDVLNSDALHLAKALNTMIYPGIDGSGYLALESDAIHGVPGHMLTIFTQSEDFLSAACEIIPPLAALKQDGYLELLLNHPPHPSQLSRLHDLLLQCSQ